MRRILVHGSRLVVNLPEANITLIAGDTEQQLGVESDGQVRFTRTWFRWIRTVRWANTTRRTGRIVVHNTGDAIANGKGSIANSGHMGSGSAKVSDTGDVFADKGSIANSGYMDNSSRPNSGPVTITIPQGIKTIVVRAAASVVHTHNLKADVVERY